MIALLCLGYLPYSRLASYPNTTSLVKL
jgi:hypothetical protein